MILKRLNNDFKIMKKLKLWLVDSNNFEGYEVYRSFLVVSESEDITKHYQPENSSQKAIYIDDINKVRE